MAVAKMAEMMVTTVEMQQKGCFPQQPLPQLFLLAQEAERRQSSRWFTIVGVILQSSRKPR